MTYTIRYILEHEHGLSGLKTSAVLTRLKRLKREGKVALARSWFPGCHMEWKIA